LVTKETVFKLLTVVIIVVLVGYTIHSYTRRVDGISMFPTLREGDVVVIQPVQLSSVSVGDIIVYGPPCSTAGEDIIHRVVAVTNSGLITQGDNRRTNPYTDQRTGIAISPITQECLVGKVVFVIPYLDLIATLPGGISYILAAVIIFFVLLSELTQNGKEEREFKAV
jgi:signal peptidase I